METKFHTNLTVASSPHQVSNEDTRRIMSLVLIALVPSLAVSTYVFGVRALILTAVCIIASVGFEYLFNMVVKRPQTVGDCSATLTGVLIAFNVPSNLPYWIAVVGCFVAIVVVKGLFGGLGKNLFNPAIVARIVLFISFATQMTTWPVARSVDGTTGPTPLGLLKEGGDNLPSNMDMFMGFIGGSMGEVSAAALLIGGLFLIWKKVISPVTPICFIATVGIIAVIAGQDPMFHICAGGVMLGAFFMATDYVTTPVLTKGKIIFGIGCGVMTMLIRLFGAYPEGVSFAILLMNVLTPHIDNFCQNSMYKVKGGVKNEK